MNPSKYICIVLSIAMLSACAKNPSQTNYNERDVGQNTTIEYGKVASQRVVDITGTNSGGGALLGGLAGGVAGSTIGNGNGSVLAALGGVIIGGIAGHVAEQELKDRQGIEYIVKFYGSGETRSIVQNIAKTDQPIANGTCVMVQQNASYQRVLPADPDDEDCAKPIKHKKRAKKQDSAQ
jgi:outer membrane lipoprotein SlyB